LSNILL